MTKTFMLSVAFAAAVSSQVFAADAVETIPQAPVAVDVASPFSWSGPYLGLHGGYGWGEVSDGAGGEDDFDGGRFGVFAGYNWQMANGFVVGVEGDVNYDWNENEYDLGGGATGEIDTGFSGSVRGRVGYAVDRALLYVAGGWTATNLSVDGGAVDDDDTLHGWTLGAGVDYAFTDNMFGRLEYRYNDYSDGDIAGFEPDFDQHVVQVGIGVKF
jgi:outer membrane immunogenic protein